MGKLSEIKTCIETFFHLQKNETFETFYNAGVDAYSKKDYENAIKNFKLASEQEKVRPQVYYNLGLTYQCMKEYEKAISSYLRFLEINPDDYDGLYNIALTYFNQNNYPKAIEYFKKCSAIKQEEEALKALVLAYLSNNEIQNAFEFSKTILETCKNDIDLYYKLAKVFETKNSLNKDFTLIDKAIEMYLKIIERNSKHFDAYLSISICFAKKGEWEMSVEFCNKVLELKPDSYEANNQMGLVYYCCDEIKKAVGYYETALKLKPDGDYKVYSNLAYAYEKDGQHDNAIKIFTKLLNKFPEFPAKDEVKNHLRVLKTL